METFYKHWLEKNKKENNQALSDLNTHQSNASENKVQSEEENNSNDVLPTSDLRNNIIYQNNQMQLYLEKGQHQRQIRFQLQDHLYFMKIKLIDSNAEPPLLRDILDFLEQAFNHILLEVRKFYKPEDHNVAFLTLYQEPMISGLNTGTLCLHIYKYAKIVIVFSS
jgi:hypothetical protein